MDDQLKPERSPNGTRIYDPAHVEAVAAARDVSRAIARRAVRR